MCRITFETRSNPVRIFVTCIAACFILFFSGEAESSDNTNESAWESQPPPDSYDWIQLTSGEWLKGDLEGLYRATIEFDSDKLGYKEFKWKDVKQVLSSNVLSIHFEDRIIISDYLQVTGEEVFITTGDNKKEFDRAQIVSITPGYFGIVGIWKTRIGLGLNITKGNTDQIQYNMMTNLKRRTVRTEFAFDYLGIYASTDNEQTSGSHRISSYFDIHKTRDYFIRLIHAEYDRDPFQNINYRGTVGAGIGVDLIDTKRTTWNIKAGPAYQKTRFKSVEEGRDSTASTAALVAGTYFDTELSSKLDFIAKYTFYIVDRKSGLYIHHAIMTLNTELTAMLDLDISCIWDRTQEPAPKSDGTIPERDDFKMIFSISLDL